MKRLLASLRWEIVLQFRNGLYHATAFVLAFWALLLTQFSLAEYRAYLPGALLGNLPITSLYFMAGLVMLEKGEGSLEARRVSPMGSGYYLLIKVLALSLLILIENLSVAGLWTGFRLAPLPLALGLLFGGAMLTLYGFITVVPYHSVNEYLMPSVLYLLPTLLPLLNTFGLVTSPLFYLHPLQAAVVLLEGGFRSLSPLEWLYGLGYGGLAVGFLFWYGRKAFRRFVVVA